MAIVPDLLKQHIPEYLLRKRTIQIECGFSANLPWDDESFISYLKKQIELITERGKEVEVFKFSKVDSLVTYK